MDLEQLKQLLDLVREHELSEFEIEQQGLRVKIRKNAHEAPIVTLPAAPAVPAVVVPTALAGSVSASALAAPAAAAGDSAAQAPNASADAEAEIELAVVKSPIVGTFYRAPEPGAPSFVEVGSTVRKGQVLCIIEAMKLMNEIDSEYDGEVANIYVENGQPVQYGERLFAIRTK
jgi:acetyl-CoA carboxylase biotin carboxyl carrier protein